MAIVKEIPTGRSFNNDRGKRSYTRLWEVHFTSMVAGDEAVTEVGEIIYQSYFGTGLPLPLLTIGSECVSDDGLKWKVSATYGMIDNDNQQDTNPLNEPWDIQTDNTNFTAFTDVSYDGTPMRNAAGDPFSDPVEFDDKRPTLSITRNELNFSPAVAYNYRNAVNSDPFYGVGPGQCKVSSIKGQKKYYSEGGFWYWTVSYQFEFNPNGFDVSIQNKGFRELKNGNPVRILDKSGEPVSEPVFLDSSGAVLPQGGQPIAYTYQIYPRLPFGVFNL